MSKKLTAESYIKAINRNKSEYWEKIQIENTLSLFHNVAENVPAYKEFLKNNKINHKEIKNWEDFQKIPPVDKKNYLKTYPFEKLFWNGNLNKPLIYTSTSGSTGEPYYFARGEMLDWQYSIIIEQFLNLRNNYIKKPTLVIVCFGMGVWIGGVITYKAYELVANRNNYPVSIITPGISKKDIYSALKNLAPKYDQIILIGYAPFLKDVIDEASTQGVDLKKMNIRFQFAAESITEQFRDYIAKESGIKNSYLDFMNIYGSADIGAMAFESTTSILIRRLAMNNKNVFNDIFSPIKKSPTLAQYIPDFINFESINGKIVLSGSSELPLVRYSIGDNGGVFSFNEVNEKLKKHGIDIFIEAKKLGIEDAIIELPFVFVHERANLSVTFFGINIYPEWLRDSLLESGISNYVTGKFTLFSKHDKDQNQILEINIEKRANAKLNSIAKKNIEKKVVAALQQNSSEFRELTEKIGQRAHPRIKFMENGDKDYFPSGIKQKWVKK
jgi:phenylacetate-CoA ligase